MAYVDIGDVTDGGTIETTWGDQVRANFQAGVPDIFTTKGDLAVATGADAASRLAAGANDSILVYASGEATGMATQIIPAVHLTKSGTTVMEVDVWTTLEFDDETADTDAMHSGDTNPTRITIPAGGDGWYLFGFSGRVDDGTPVRWQVRFLLNGATEIGAGGMSSYGFGPLSVVVLRPVVATNYIEVQYYSNFADTISASPIFWAIWQRRQ